MSTDWLAAALTAIDEANAHDPTLVDTVQGPVPKEVVHARRMTHWLHRLAAEPDAAQQLAARAHHLRRWEHPRSAFPEGRAGYLRWRRAARDHHAEDFAALGRLAGVPDDVLGDAARIIRKDGLGSDPRVQVHEDALCLTFFELQGAATVEQLGDKAPAVVERTLAKMSVEGHRLLREAGLHPDGEPAAGAADA